MHLLMSEEASTVPCLLCRQVCDGGDHGQYGDHLKDVHGVWSNRSWLVDETFIRQNNKVVVVTNVEFQDVMTKIKVKLNVEAEAISDIPGLSVNAEGSNRGMTLRRSSRKRPASRSPVEVKEAKLKVDNPQVSTSIREPADKLMTETGAESSVNGSISNPTTKGNCGRGVGLYNTRGHAADRNFCKADKEKVSTDYASHELENERRSNCVESDEMFTVSSMQIHLEKVPGKSMKDLVVLGDASSGKIELAGCENQVHLKICGGEAMTTKDMNDNNEVKVVNTKDVNKVPSCDKGAVPCSLISFSSAADEEVQITWENNPEEDFALSDVLKGDAMEVNSEEDIEIDKGKDNLTKVKMNYATINNLSDEELVPVKTALKDVQTQEDSSSVKEDEKLLPVNMSHNDVKIYSDNFSDSCIVLCSICDKHMSAERLRAHTSSQHHLPISKYKEQFGSQPHFVKMTFHLCKLCGKEVLLDKDSIATHVRSSHKWTAKQYNSEHMGYRKGTVDQSLFENGEKSPAAGSSQASSTAVQNQWFDANTYTCNICTFVSSSLETFKKHVKSVHETSLAKFSASYSNTDVWYKCQCCDKEVFHEKNSIKTHVKGHFLSMEQYAKFYERKSILKLEEVNEHGMVSLNLQPCHEQELLRESEETDPGKDPLEITSTSVSEDTEENPHPTGKHILSTDRPPVSPSVLVLNPESLPAQENNNLPGIKNSGNFEMTADIRKSVIPPTEILYVSEEVSQPEVDTSTPCSVICNPTCESSAKDKVASSSPTLPDIFLYMCPFPACDYHTDYKGMQSGRAADHGMAAHQADPVQMKAGGFRWKKISLESRMEELFAED